MTTGRAEHKPLFFMIVTMIMRSLKPIKCLIIIFRSGSLMVNCQELWNNRARASSGTTPYPYVFPGWTRWTWALLMEKFPQVDGIVLYYCSSVGEDLDCPLNPVAQSASNRCLEVSLAKNRFISSTRALDTSRVGCTIVWNGSRASWVWRTQPCRHSTEPKYS